MRALRSNPAAGLGVLSALLFLAYAALAPRERETIRVTSEMIDAIVANQEALVGRRLSAEEREQAIDAFIEDEVLIREAYRQGLDVGDRRVRGSLTAAGQFTLIDPHLDPPEPTPEEIAEFYQANREDYRMQAAITVQYVSFLPGSLPPEREEEVLLELRAGKNPASVGGGLGQTQTVRGVTRTGLSISNGRKFAADVFDYEIGAWEAPLRSPQGIFYNRILERRPSRLQSLEQADRLVRQDWVASHYTASLQEALADVRKRYEIEIQDVGGVQ